MWKIVATVCVVLFMVISSDFAEAGPRNKNKGQGQGATRAGKGKGAEVKDPNCSNWTFSACQFKNGKTCGRGTKQGSRTGDSCQVKTKQMPCVMPCKPTCDYNKGGEWQACNAGKMSRTLQLKPGQPSTCEQTKTITKKCKAKAAKPGKATKSLALDGGSLLANNNKMRTVCRYSKATWSECTDGKMTRTVTLKGARRGCEPSKVETKDCAA